MWIRESRVRWPHGVIQNAIKCKQLINWNILCAVNVLNHWQVLLWGIVGTVQNLFIVSVSRKLEKSEPSCMTMRSNWSVDHPVLFKDGTCSVDQSWGFKTELKQIKGVFFLDSQICFTTTQSNTFFQRFNQPDTSRYCAAPLDLLLPCSWAPQQWTVREGELHRWVRSVGTEPNWLMRQNYKTISSKLRSPADWGADSQWDQQDEWTFTTIESHLVHCSHPSMTSWTRLVFLSVWTDIMWVN